MGKLGEKQKKKPKISDKKQSERFKATAREVGAEQSSGAFDRIIEQMGRTLPDFIRPKKLEIYGLLIGIRDCVERRDHAGVDTRRVALSLLARLDIEQPGELYASVRRVFDLSGKWDRKTLPDEGEAEISEVVDKAISLLNS
jgi:hypothetical protein